MRLARRTARGPVPTHPLATPDPAVLRWVVPDGLLPFAGTVAAAPTALQALMDDGTLAAVEAVPGAVLTLLADDRDWADEGARVRTALVEALASPQDWRGTEQASAVGPDEALRAAAQEIAAGRVGAFARSHGGTLEVRSVRDGVVEVAMEGACHDCAAAAITMHARFEHLLRRRCPWLAEVREAV